MSTSTAIALVTQSAPDGGLRYLLPASVGGQQIHLVLATTFDMAMLSSGSG